MPANISQIADMRDKQIKICNNVLTMAGSSMRQELTPTVEQAAQQVLHQAQSTSQLIIVEGLSGVGKTALLNRVTPEIEASGGLIIGQEQFEKQEVGSDETDRSVIVTATITKDFNRGGFHYGVRNLFPGREVSEMILSGMPADQTESFVAKLPRGEVAPELIAYYSMGVPLLARRFARAGSTAQIEREGMGYVRHATTYNAVDVRGLADFLQMPVPAEFFPGRSTDRNKQIYSRVDHAERERAALVEKGIVEESPLFVAAESERIYNAMLQNEGGLSEIEIFIPQMSPADFARLQQALGWDPSSRVGTERGVQVGDYRQEKSTRASMFWANFRKMSFWHKTTEGTEYDLDNEFGHGHITPTIESYQELLRSGQLGLPTAVAENSPSIWLHSHEHNGMSEHTARFGWMVESLLQQRRIAYFVNNETCDTSYAYLPEEERIAILPERVKVDRYRW